MNLFKCILMVLWSLTLLTVIVSCRPTPQQSFFLGGIQVNEPDYESWIQTLKETGFNTVAVTVYARQGDWDNPNLWFAEEAEWVVKEIRIAKKSGLKVVFILRIQLDHAFERNRFLWHGMIMPQSDEDLESWFRRYGKFAHHWASVAEAEGVDILGIASEMNSMTSTNVLQNLPALESYYLNPIKGQEFREKTNKFAPRIETKHLHGSWGETYDSLDRYLDDRIEAHRNWAEQVTYGANLEAMNKRRQILEHKWVKLITEIRDVFSGALTYAANFDQYEMVRFWDHLDYIGVSSYFPLRKDRKIHTLSQLYPILEDGWSKILIQIDEFRKKVGAADKPLLLTELGYTFFADSTIEPWAADGFSLIGDWEDPELMIWNDRPVNYEERALAVRALRHAAKAMGENFLKGILYWKLSTQEIHRESEPFLLIIGPESQDPMLAELLGFIRE